jgi:hypothetical protein
VAVEQTEKIKIAFAIGFMLVAFAFLSVFFWM